MPRRQTAFRDKPLKHKLSYVTQLTTGVALLVAFIAIISLELVNGWQSMLGHISVTANMVASNVRAAMVFDDQSFAENSLQVLKLEPDVRVAALYRPDETVFATYRRPDYPDIALPPPQIQGEYRFAQGLLTIVQPISLEGESVGTLVISSDLNDYLGRIAWFTLITVAIVLLSFIVVYPLWARLQHMVSDPIHSLLGVVKKVSGTNDYSLRATPYGKDELGQLIEGFNLMLQQIQSRDQELELHRRNLEEEVRNRTIDLLRAKEAAEAANRTKSEFLANVSHEVRTPMNALLGLTDLTLKTELSVKQKDYLDKIHSSAHSLLEIINDILDISKIEAGGMQLECIDFDLNQVLENLAAITGINAAEKNLLLNYQTDPDIPSMLRGDPLRLGQILLNLTDNALKFTASGEIRIGIELVNEETEHVTLRFSVQDTGIGVETDKIPKLFEPFTQADGSHSRIYGGTGLGLTISKYLVELMGGEIGLNSTVGKGSTFHFTVEFAKQPVQDQQATDTPRIELVTGSEPGIWESVTAEPLITGRVLLVEDNPINQQIAQELLEVAGLSVRVAGDGLQALEILQQEQFDVVLMDIQMPHMDGYETTRHLRSDPHTRHLTIIAMTAHNMPGDREKCLAAGMDDYLAKPIKSEFLYRTLVKWMALAEETGTAQPAVAAVSGPRVLLPDSLPGIDIETGLRTVKGNRELYRELLDKFYLEYRDGYTRITDALENQDLEEAGNLVHALKGISGNLAATDIYQACVVVEAALHSRQLSPLIQQRLQQAMQQVLSGLSELSGDAVHLTTPTGGPPDTDLVESLLEELDELLAQGDYQATNSLGELTASLAGQSADLVYNLGRQINTFAYADARLTLKQIRQELGVSPGAADCREKV